MKFTHSYSTYNNVAYKMIYGISMKYTLDFKDVVW